MFQRIIVWCLAAPAASVFLSSWGMRAMNNRPDDGTLEQIVGSVSSEGTSGYAVRYTPGLGVVPLGWLKNPGNNPIGVATDIDGRMPPPLTQRR